MDTVPYIPLNRTWTLFFHANDKQKKYSDNRQKLIDISDIKTFWCTINNIPLPTTLFSDGTKTKKVVKKTGQIPHALSFFTSGIDPSWEDPKNIHGAELSIRRFKDVSDMDNLWVNLLVSLISEDFENSEHVNGIRIVDCTRETQIMYRIEFWYDDVKLTPFFETKIKELANLPHYTKLLYREHSSVKES